MATMVRSHFCPHSSPCSGWIAIALIKERAAAGMHSHLCPCSGPCIVGGLLLSWDCLRALAYFS